MAAGSPFALISYLRYSKLDPVKYGRGNLAGAPRFYRQISHRILGPGPRARILERGL